jgi:hypothetical protein
MHSYLDSCPPANKTATKTKHMFLLSASLTYSENNIKNPLEFKRGKNRNAITSFGYVAPTSLSLLNTQSPWPPTIDLFMDQLITRHEA